MPLCRGRPDAPSRVDLDGVGPRASGLGPVKASGVQVIVVTPPGVILISSVSVLVLPPQEVPMEPAAQRPGPSPAKIVALSSEELRRIDAYWRAANYLSVGQIYLYDNPLLTKPLTLDHVKPRLLGHWGTTPGLNFTYVHCNRLIRKY